MATYMKMGASVRYQVCYRDGNIET